MLCYHFTSAPLGASAMLLPAHFGSGCATRSDQLGLPKVFLFAEGSTLGADARLLGWRSRYAAMVDESTLYDLREADPLGWRAEPDRAAADARIIAEGHKGLRLRRSDGAEIVCCFGPVECQRDAGGTSRS